VAAVFLVRLGVRGRVDVAPVGAGSVPVLTAWVSCSARRWFSVRAVSRSVSARSARIGRASRVSSNAVMRALVAVVSWSSARSWSARTRRSRRLRRPGRGRRGDSGGLGLAGSGGVLLGLLQARGGVSDLAGSTPAGLRRAAPSPGMGDAPRSAVCGSSMRPGTQDPKRRGIRNDVQPKASCATRVDHLESNELPCAARPSTKDRRLKWN